MQPSLPRTNGCGDQSAAKKKYATYQQDKPRLGLLAKPRQKGK